MARITEQDLEAILPNPEDFFRTPFIDAASRLVTARLAGSGLSDAVLADIELFVAAHLVTVLQRREKREKIGEAEVEYQSGDLGKFLQSTDYGQAALTLDTSGRLINVGQVPYLFDAVRYSPP